MLWNLHTSGPTTAKDLQAELEKQRDLYMAKSGILDLDLRKSLAAQMTAALNAACALATTGTFQVSLSGSVAPVDDDIVSRIMVAVDTVKAKKKS